MQFSDLQRGRSDEVAEFGRLDDLGFGAEGEYLGGCRVGRTYWQPCLYPSSPSGCSPPAIPANTQAFGSAAQGGEPPAARGQLGLAEVGHNARNNRMRAP